MKEKRHFYLNFKNSEKIGKKKIFPLKETFNLTNIVS